jgi:phosphoribosyl-ATP pyrophosphohydrolase/phosphoribosyl-AMP cyclohydrolase
VAAESFRFDEQGLLPAIVQDWRDGTVLMLGYMNREALDRTLSTQSVHFWSRSRNRLWEKGETSGHRLHLKDLFLDCDGDTILIKAEPMGPTCHTGERACFFRRVQPDGQVAETKTSDAWGALLEQVSATIRDRKAHPVPGSYVTALFEKGHDQILKKVAEEAGEVILAAKNGKRAELTHEVADLLFHLLVVLADQDLSLLDIEQELANRIGRRRAPKQA